MLTKYFGFIKLCSSLLAFTVIGVWSTGVHATDQYGHQSLGFDRGPQVEVTRNNADSTSHHHYSEEEGHHGADLMDREGEHREHQGDNRIHGHSSETIVPVHNGSRGDYFYSGRHYHYHHNGRYYNYYHNNEYYVYFINGAYYNYFYNGAYYVYFVNGRYYNHFYKGMYYKNCRRMPGLYGHGHRNPERMICQ